MCYKLLNFRVLRYRAEALLTVEKESLSNSYYVYNNLNNVKQMYFLITVTFLHVK